MRRRKRNYNYSPYRRRRRIRWDNVLKVVIPVVVVLVLVITFNFSRIRLAMKGYSWSQQSAVLKLTSDKVKMVIDDDYLDHLDSWLKHSKDVKYYADFEKYQSLHKKMKSADVVDTLTPLLVDQVPTLKKKGFTEKQIWAILKTADSDDLDYAKEDINSFTLGLQNSMMNYLNSQDSKQVINQFINKVIKDNHLEEQLNTIMAGYMQNVSKQLSTSLSQAFTFNPDIFKQAIKMNRDSTDMTELMKSMMNTEQTSYDNNLKKFGYCDFDNPNSISIFPQDFEKKQSVLNYLDHYNEKMKKIDEDKVITYTDVVGTLMSSVTDIVDQLPFHQIY